jgi:biotin synthase-like enzyme
MEVVMSERVIMMQLIGGWRFCAALRILRYAAMLRLISPELAIRLASGCVRMLRLEPTN